jgi:hypothetical protein
MNQPDEAWWARARAARNHLETLIIQDPNVRMIGIGIDPQKQSDLPVLLVHARDPSALSSVVPSHVDGIPVRVVSGDYQPEQGGV